MRSARQFKVQSSAPRENELPNEAIPLPASRLCGILYSSAAYRCEHLINAIFTKRANCSARSSEFQVQFTFNVIENTKRTQGVSIWLIHSPRLDVKTKLPNEAIRSARQFKVWSLKFKVVKITERTHSKSSGPESVGDLK